MSYRGGGYRDYNNRNNYHNQNNRGWRDNNNNNNNHNNNNNNNSYYGGGNRYQHQQQNSQYYSRNQNNYHNNNNNYNNNRYINNNNNNDSNQNQRWNNTHNENNNYEFQTKSYQNKSGSPGKQGQQYQTTQSGAAAAAAAVATTPVEAAPPKAKSPLQENDKNNGKNKRSASSSSSSEEEELDARHDFWDDEEEDVNVYHLIYYDEDYERAQDLTMDLLENSEDGELTDKDESTLRCYLGTIYTRGYEYHYEAKEEFEKAIKLDDKNDLAYYEYGDMLYELGQYTQALKYFEKACQLKPNNSLYKDDYNEAKDEIERDGLEDAPMPQELLEPCAPADGEDDGFVDDREDYEREDNDDANDANDGKAQGSKATKNTEQAQGYNNKKLGSMPEDKEANVGYEDNEEEYDDDDDYGDEDEYSSEFERFWESFSQWDNEDEDYYYAFEEHGLDDIRILVTQKLNDDFEKRVLNDQIGMSKEHSGYFMKRLMQLQKDNGDFKNWLQSIQLFDEYYTNVFEDSEIVTFNAFYYWIQSKDDLLEYIASDTIDENSTDFKLLWETNPRYVRNHPNDKDGVLLCSACQQKINENGQNFQENDNGNNNDNAPTKQNGK